MTRRHEILNELMKMRRLEAAEKVRKITVEETGRLLQTDGKNKQNQELGSGFVTLAGKVSEFST